MDFKFYKNLKEYAKDKKIWYAHFINKKNKWEAWGDLLRVPKDCLYIDKESLLIELLKEKQNS